MDHLNQIMALVTWLGLSYLLKVFLVDKYELKIRDEFDVVLFYRGYWNQFLLICSYMMIGLYFAFACYVYYIPNSFHKLPIVMGEKNMIFIAGVLGLYYFATTFTGFNENEIIIKSLRKHKKIKYDAIKCVYVSQEERMLLKQSKTVVVYTMFTEKGESIEINDLDPTFTPEEFKRIDKKLRDSKFYMLESLLNSEASDSNIILDNINRSRDYEICNDIEYIKIKVLRIRQ